ncbi:MAG: ribosome assembly factor SBDS [Candidatus Parvarchaeota archaeon]|nr:ribosome assembly factor SBDS [Candidatus Jingweiarchaeum tengchongense]MCW1298499.1 ribosome assembly factor SBDS [Candidatus Jingweiarchaeum tengchongense]MCW1300255.1 ribosome assembly factor SBDS [Candidatus Jingweiarchaeum tengchongense]MCW1304511.1 ribosome assembly factor SBDS [Candidatus Jingweiarchaeum tengchongense]MCW1305761.1 ribosome assembly factor SBDS [Candidatus Jingweiarchaeum tengchongense]
MVKIEDAVIARLKKDNKVFEILVDCEKALDFKKGKSVSIRDVLAVEGIFKDAKKGEKASGIKDVFGTDDVFAISEKIIKEGEIQLTTEYRRKLVEDKKKQIIDAISKKAIDPRTNLPIPPTRIELAMEQARVHIDPFKSIDEQVKSVIDAIKFILPIKIEKKKIQIISPVQYSSRILNFAQRHCEIKKEEWLNDGSLVLLIEIPAGTMGEVLSEINKISGGKIESKIIE